MARQARAKAFNAKAARTPIKAQTDAGTNLSAYVEVDTDAENPMRKQMARKAQAKAFNAKAARTPIQA